jgi:hypothetical protein
MKIILDCQELTNLLKKTFPKELIPDTMVVSNIKTHGYPVDEFEIVFEEDDFLNEEKTS